MPDRTVSADKVICAIGTTPAGHVVTLNNGVLEFSEITYDLEAAIKAALDSAMEEGIV